MLNIWRYNRPQYFRALLVVIALLVLNVMTRPRDWIWYGLWAACIATAYWSLASLAVSHWVYDRSELMRLGWLAALLPGCPSRVLVLHAGVDDSSGALRALFPSAEVVVLDFFAPHLMDEPSIRRARGLRGVMQIGTVPHHNLPCESGSIDLVTVIFAAHELRKPSDRRMLLLEVRRLLRPDGTVLVVEHLRDFANFVAFGPGFTHFHSAAAWRRDFQSSGLRIDREKRITPFVRVSLLKLTV